MLSKKENPKGRMFFYGYMTAIGVLGFVVWYFYDKNIFSFAQKIIPYDVLFMFMLLLVTATALVEVIRAYRKWRISRYA